MLKTSAKKRAAVAAYQKQPDQVAKRVARNKARRHAIADGKAEVGDHTDVDHITPLRKGGSAEDSNTRVVDRTKNRKWRLGKKGYDTRS